MNFFLLRRINVISEGVYQLIEAEVVFNAVIGNGRIDFNRKNGDPGFCFDSESEIWTLENISGTV